MLRAIVLTCVLTAGCVEAVTGDLSPPTNAATAETLVSFSLVCRGSGSIPITARCAFADASGCHQIDLLLQFSPGTQPVTVAGSGQPWPQGECRWWDRAFFSDEPSTLENGGLNLPTGLASLVHNGLQWSTFLVHNTGFSMMVDATLCTGTHVTGVCQ
jgi:hypothetical protein